MILVYFFAGLLGLCIGSFLNVVIYRLPLKMSLASPPSHCTKCSYQLKWYDNIPLLSYLFLGGKCRKCKTKISPRYPLIELLNALLYLICVFMFWENSVVYSIISMLLCSVLICVLFIDLDHMLIFDRFQILVLILGVVAMFFDSYTVFYDHLIGLGAGLVSFLLIYYGAILVLKKEGLGFGDVKLASVCGLFLGWQRFIFAIMVASIVAVLVLLPIKFIKKTERGREFPFAPFIVIGTLVALFVGEIVITWYVGILTI